MGKLVVPGPGAAAALNRMLANDLDRIGAGQAQYSMLCNESGGVVDDLIVYRLGDDELRIVPNAANAATVRDGLATGLPEGVTLTDLHEAEGILAIQGPGSRQVMLDLGLLAAGDDLAYMAFTTAEFAGTPAVVCRTGYTGQHGYEVIIGVEALPALWARVAELATPCGLGARDTLRTEMGYPLHGQDLSTSITPVEAGLSWAVGWDKAEFVGREALVAQRAAGRPRALRGLLLEGRGVPRAHMGVQLPDGSAAGETTSGTSPRPSRLAWPWPWLTRRSRSATRSRSTSAVVPSQRGSCGCRSWSRPRSRSAVGADPVRRRGPLGEPKSPLAMVRRDYLLTDTCMKSPCVLTLFTRMVVPVFGTGTLAHPLLSMAASGATQYDSRSSNVGTAGRPP